MPYEVRVWHNNPEESYSTAELLAILSRALDEIEAPLRVVFALCDMEGFSLEETAGILQLPLANVVTRLTQARLKLRQSLGVWFENLSVPAARQDGCKGIQHFLELAMAEDRKCT